MVLAMYERRGNETMPMKVPSRIYGRRLYVNIQQYLLAERLVGASVPTARPERCRYRHFVYAGSLRP